VGYDISPLKRQIKFQNKSLVFFFSSFCKSNITKIKDIGDEHTNRREKKKRNTKNNMGCTIKNEIEERRCIFYLGHNRKKSQQQRRVEETCPCPICAMRHSKD
jgi:hypothetical protein